MRNYLRIICGLILTDNTRCSIICGVKMIDFTDSPEGAESMAINPNITILLDLYGALLTEKERDTLEYYYNDDLSLKEIADNEALLRRARADSGSGNPNERTTITRQGVRDTIKRAEAKLLDWESRLHLLEKAQMNRLVLDEICTKAREISDYNIHNSCIREINDAVTTILSLAHDIYE